MRRVIHALLALTVLVPMPWRHAAAADDGPLEIRLTVPDRARLEQLSRLVSIYAVRDGEVLAVASPGQLERLATAGFRWRVVEKIAAAEVEMCPEGWVQNAQRTWSCYPTYGQYRDLLTALAEDYPALCRLEDLGATSSQVRPHRLWAVRISDNVALEEAEPEVLITSSMHGDEASGFVLSLRLAHELLSNYGVDPEITNLVDSYEIWINPNANPDGCYFTSDDTVEGSIRYYTSPTGDSSSVDANRNFPDPDDGDHPDGNPWWPETRAMMAFAEAHSITLSANLHDGAELVNYPWDTWSRRHTDDALLAHISRVWADLAQADGPPGYMTDQDNGITNGWDWFPVAGGRQDFMTFWHSDREVTVELSHVKTPSGSMVEELWIANRRALLAFIDQAGLGIHGVVTGPDGEPVAATIEVVGVDTAIDNSYGRTDPDVGDFHRLLLPGSYSIRISALGFQSQLLEDLTVVPEGTTTVDVVLQPAAVTLVGRVTTPASRLPVAGATVELVDTPLSTVTAPDGSYTLTGVPPSSSFTVRASAVNFDTAERVVSVTEPPSVLDLMLAPLSFSRVTPLVPVE